MPVHFWPESYSQQEKWVHILLLLTISSPLFWAQEQGPLRISAADFFYQEIRDRSWKFCLRAPQQGAERGTHSSRTLSGRSHSVSKPCLSRGWRELSTQREDGLGDWIFVGSGQEVKEVAIKCINSSLVSHLNLIPLMVPVPLFCTANVYTQLKDSTKFWAPKIRTLIRLQKSTCKPEKQGTKNGIHSGDRGNKTHI